MLLSNASLRRYGIAGLEAAALDQSMPQDGSRLNADLLSASTVRGTSGLRRKRRAPGPWAELKRLAGSCFQDYARRLDGPALGHLAMKVKIEIDCTPIEARDFLGLPDVKPMQEAMMDQMQA